MHTFKQVGLCLLLKCSHRDPHILSVSAHMDGHPHIPQICICALTFIYMNAHMCFHHVHTWVHNTAYTCMHVSKYILMFIHIDLHVLLACAHVVIIHINRYVYTYSCYIYRLYICVYIYIFRLYILMYIHMHMHIGTCRDPHVLLIYTQRYKSTPTHIQVCTYTCMDTDTG